MIQMKLITANKLNRLWKNGIVPKLNGKIDKTKVLTTKEQVAANTNAENVASAVVVKEINNDLSKVNTYVGSDGKLHFVNSAGADTVLNFSSFETGSVTFSGTHTTKNIPIKRYPKFVAVICNATTSPTPSIWYNGTFYSKGLLDAVSNEYLTLKSSWNTSWTFTYYIVY